MDRAQRIRDRAREPRPAPQRRGDRRHPASERALPGAVMSGPMTDRDMMIPLAGIQELLALDNLAPRSSYFLHELRDRPAPDGMVAATLEEVGMFGRYRE